jgi:peptidoglycan/xylan/chitin deacetylase (PgdA/CDA1 family)
MAKVAVEGTKWLSRILCIIGFRIKAIGIAFSLANRSKPKRGKAGKLAFPFVNRRIRRNLQILTYHRVNDERDPFFPAMATKVFEGQMGYLSTACNVFALDRGVEMLKAGTLPDNAVAVTFDDGYKDNFLNAYPILKHYDIPATIFLSTDSVNGGADLWHDRVFKAFRETQRTALVKFGKCAERLDLKSLAGKLDTMNEVLKFLRSLDVQSRWQWVKRLCESLGVEDGETSKETMLDWEEIRMMHANGIRLGSHTCSHAILSRLEPEELWKEVCFSKGAIENAVRCKVSMFAYPNGTQDDFDERTKRALRDAGYELAVSTIFGNNEVGQDVFELRRVSQMGEELDEFAMKLAWYKWYY